MKYLKVSEKTFNAFLAESNNPEPYEVIDSGKWQTKLYALIDGYSAMSRICDFSEREFYIKQPEVTQNEI